MSNNLNHGISKLSCINDGRPYVITPDSQGNYHTVYPKDSSYENFKEALNEFHTLDKQRYINDTF